MKDDWPHFIRSRKGSGSRLFPTRRPAAAAAAALSASLSSSGGRAAGGANGLRVRLQGGRTNWRLHRRLLRCRTERRRRQYDGAPQQLPESNPTLLWPGHSSTLGSNEA